MVGVVFTLAMYFVGRYAPGAAEDVRMVIVSVDVLLGIVIGAWCVEDAAAKLGKPIMR
jgi:hypothetical protein